MKKDTSKNVCIDCQCQPVKVHTERFSKSSMMTRTEYSCGAIRDEVTNANHSRVSHSGCTCTL